VSSNLLDATMQDGTYQQERIPREQAGVIRQEEDLHQETEEEDGQNEICSIVDRTSTALDSQARMPREEQSTGFLLPSPHLRTRGRRP